jgi:aspartyl protease family protein
MINALSLTTLDIGHLAYLVLLLCVLVVGVFARRRAPLGQSIKTLAQWGLIFAVVAVGAGLWGDIRTTVMPQQSVFESSGVIEIPRARDGHYYAQLEINGAKVDFVVDTGASSIVLTQDDAKRVGIPMDRLTYYGEANTANGVVRTAPVTLPDVAFGPHEDRNVRALVNNGRMEKSLLGMSYLQRFSNIQITNNTLILQR